MKKIILFFFLGIAHLAAWAQTPSNDDINNATNLTDLFGYCSADAAYTSVGATPSGFGKSMFWNSSGKDVWFKFTAQRFDVNVIVSGKTSASSNNTLISPLVAIYDYDKASGQINEMNGSMNSSNNVTAAYRGALVIGNVYYIRISADNDNTGSFKLCINNYTPPLKAGQDCTTASKLCSKEIISVKDISGFGTSNKEAVGTCMGTEANSAWYTWTAANTGTLTFTITPTAETDDIDWVLFDAGIAGSCNNINPSNAIRCASGSGYNCIPKYNKTGMNLTALDTKEQPGCGLDQNGVIQQDGFVQYITIQTGHIYYLLVDNVSSGTGFNLEFGGTGEFVGPQTKIDFTASSPCTIDQNFTFDGTRSTNYTRLKWTFGESASIDSASTPGPFTISYSSPGVKTAVLQVFNNEGCSVVETQTFTVGLKPDKPVITTNKPDFCIQDTIKLSTPEIQDGIYHWSGPNNFSSTEREVNIPVDDFSVSGTYRLTTEIFGCMSEETTAEIPPVLKKPVAAFSTSPGIVAKFSAPLTVTFTNESTEADTYLWDFGDGTTSTEINPVHEYTLPGDYDVTLTAFKSTVCQTAVVKGTFVIRTAGSLFIPNTFTPNSDGINDEFVVTLTNLNAYHIRIFNRWGEQLFEAHDIFNNWKGQYKGEFVPVGTYFYIIEASDMNNLIIKRSGSVTVLR